MKFSYPNAEAIPAAHRNEYEERDGAFVLKVEELPEGVEISNVAGLKSALKKERDSNKTLATRIAELDDDGAVHTRKLADRVDALSASNAKLLTALNKQRLTNCTLESIHEARGNPALLRPILEKRINIGDDGKPQVVDDAGQPLLNKAGEPVSVRDFVLALREMPEYMGAFAGRGHSGSGMSSSGGNGGTITVTPHRSKMSVREKADFIKTHGTKKFMELPI